MGSEARNSVQDGTVGIKATSSIVRLYYKSFRDLDPRGQREAASQNGLRKEPATTATTQFVQQHC